MADKTTPIFSIDYVSQKAMLALKGNDLSLQEGDITSDQHSGAKAGILTIVLLLGLDVQFADGTVWRAVKPDDTVTNENFQRAVEDGKKERLN